jgi:hypothetical protein
VTLFNKVDYTLGSLIDSIASGQLGLPDIQRPFVWRNVKIRNLFDSMYRGYPVGFLLFWETGVQAGTRQVGVDTKQLAPTRVIVDGQQRLTSLYAVVRGVPVIRENFTSEKIEIAFNPLDERFEVADAAIRRDKTFIPNISALWDPKIGLIKFASDYVDGLRTARGGEISSEEIAKAQTAIQKLHGLIHFPFTALELSPKVDPDQVSEVFVRINSEGKQLNQSDFILTLMSVFWDEGRTQLEDFCRKARSPGGSGPSPFNSLFQPSPDQLLRVAVAVGFRRARLSAVYSILRGREADGGDTASGRDGNFDKLKAGQKATLNVQHWHDFLKAVSLAGYRTSRIISSNNALVFAHALYLVGRTAIGVEEHELRRAIAQWLFMSSLTGRYTSSPESQMEFDLASMRGVSAPEQFLSVLSNICAARLTSDFWTVTLPGDLATSAARSPSMFAYFAALNVLDARALYSNHTVRELMDPAIQPSRTALERHHLFPVAWLKKHGVTDQRDYNQIANFTVVEWGDNAAISDAAPMTYVPDLERRFDQATLNRMYRHHAIPRGWETLAYPTFLRERRQLMAETIREAYEKLAGADKQEQIAVPVALMVETGESAALEFKSTLRINLHTGERDPKMELAVLKTIAGFLNSKGGTLMVGVADDGSLVGIERDGFPDEDKMALHLVALLKERLGGHQALYVHPRFDDYEGGRVLVVSCEAAKGPVFVKDGAAERFYVRYGPSTQELTGAHAHDFIRQRFHS